MPSEQSNGAVYPEGLDWRCPACDYTCGDDGPDRCPNDGAPLWRLAGTFKVHGAPAEPAR